MTNNTSPDGTTQRIASIVAMASIAAAVIGSAFVVRAFTVNGGRASPLVLWALVPLALTTTGLVASRTPRSGLMWISIGALYGFVVLTGFSIGLFYAYAAHLLLAAGVVHLVACQSLRRVLMVPLWVVAGLSGIPAAFLAFGEVRSMFGGPI